MTVYAYATEPAKIATDLIKKVPDHKPLADVRIEYIFRPEATRSRGRTVLAKARKVDGLNAFLAGDGASDPFFVIEFAEDCWKRLNTAQRRALVDHELMHFIAEDDGEGGIHLALRGHDLEEFTDIIKRHGFWRSDIATFSDAVAEQLSLSLDTLDRFLDDEGETT